MFEEFKRLIRHYLVYGLGALCSRIIAFLMIPVYTRFLTTHDYGTIELVMLTADVVGLVVAMGFRDSVLRFYFDEETVPNRKRVVSTGLIYTAVVAGTASLLIVIFAEPLSAAILGRDGLSTLLRLAVANYFFDLLAVVCLSYFRAEERSFIYSAILLGRLLIALALNILLVAVFRMGAMGIVVSSVISTGTTALVCLVWTLREVGLGFSRRQLRGMIAFGAPLIPASLAMFSLQFADRFFLRHLGSMEAVGIYSLAYKFAMVLSFVITEPFLLAWTTLVVPLAMRDDSQTLFSRLLTYFMAVAVFFGLGLALVGPGLIRLMAAPAFHSAGTVLPVLVLGFVVLASSYVLNSGTYIAKKMMHRAVSVISSAIVNMILNIILIPRYGIAGAAWATTLSFCVLAATAWYASQQVYPISYDMKRLAVLIAVASGVFTVGAFIPREPLWLSLFFSTVLVFCYPVILFQIRFFNREETTVAVNSFRMLREKGGSIIRGQAGVSRQP